MTTAIAMILFLIFCLISLIHFYWAFGGKWASNAVLPTEADDSTKVLNPSVLSTTIVALGLLSFCVCVLMTADLIFFKIPVGWNKLGLWIIVGIFTLRAIGDFKYVGFFKKIRQTRFGVNDTKYFSPLCFIIAMLTIVLLFAMN